jgi:hypothetical protein
MVMAVPATAAAVVAGGGGSQTQGADGGMGGATGLAGGLVLGVLARAWMRLISTDPEFSWSGTLFIVGAFGVFGLTQGLARGARRCGWRRPAVTICRLFGAVGILGPLGGPGLFMMPTVVFGGLAFARTDWSKIVRWCLVVIGALPVVAMTMLLVADLGVSLRAAAGWVGLVAIYGTVLRVAAATLAPFPDGWRLWRRRP